jgi:CPA2 family monovalent cation:H+ antiporter-2
MHGVGLLTDLAVVLCVAAVTTVLFRRLKQPVVLGYLLAGLLVSPGLPTPLSADPDRLRTLSELGVILVMFSVGLHMSVRNLIRVAPSAGVVGVVGVSTMISLGYLVTQALGWPTRESVFGGTMLAISSTMIVSRTFAEEGVRGRVADLVLGVLIIQDVAAILLIAVLTPVAKGSELEGALLAETVGRLAVFLVVVVVVGFFVVPRAIRAVERLKSPETLLVASVGLCFALAWLALEVGYSVALGAFIAGSLCAESGLGEKIGREVRPVRDIFAAIFFVAVGMQVDPAAVAAGWPAVLCLTLLVVVGQSMSGAFGAVLAGHDVHIAVRTGMSLAQIGEFAFIIAGIAGAAGDGRGAFLLPVAVAVSVITAFLTPWMVRSSARLALAVDHRLPRRVQTVISLYGAWLEAMRAARAKPEGRQGIRRLVGLILIDAVSIVAIVIGTSLSIRELVAWGTRHLALEAEIATGIVIVMALVAVAPFVIGLLRCVAALGARLAALTLPPAQQGKLDLADAPRRVLVVTVQLLLTVLVGAPVVAFTAPFLPPLVGLGVLMTALAALGMAFWRFAQDLDEHVKAGAHVVLEVLERQVAAARRKYATEPDLTLVVPFLPGLGPLTAIPLEAGSPAIGATLPSLDLHSRSGVSVIALARPSDEGVTVPSAGEPLAAGDIIAIAGSQTAIRRARELLGPSPPAGAS